MHWSRSLYGHANLYGLFTDLAVHLASRNGIIAYVTPTSFLGGQYFQSLRRLLSEEAPPLFFDFIANREGVFADALQETMLSVFKKNSTHRLVSVSYLSLKETGDIVAEENGQYHIPHSHKKPWVLPRNPQQAYLAKSCGELEYRLRDLGYTVSTGPLVWNRHKSKLFNEHVQGSIPVIWAECVNPAGTGEFTFKASSRGHAPWFKPTAQDGANVVRSSCILLQRTTSLEQARRLIAAELPQSFIEDNGGAVTVENHLNMVRAIIGQSQLVSPRVITAILNSNVVDQVFRCINGSTAVSAYELESMPLPSPAALKRLEIMIIRGSKKETIEKAITEMYSHVRSIAAA
jgi:adenine-specific DNA-methyltransferase